jgi:hypothetical protein
MYAHMLQRFRFELHSHRGWQRQIRLSTRDPSIKHPCRAVPCHAVPCCAVPYHGTATAEALSPGSGNVQHMISSASLKACYGCISGLCCRGTAVPPTLSRTPSLHCWVTVLLHSTHSAASTASIQVSLQCQRLIGCAVAQQAVIIRRPAGRGLSSVKHWHTRVCCCCCCISTPTCCSASTAAAGAAP